MIHDIFIGWWDEFSINKIRMHTGWTPVTKHPGWKGEDKSVDGLGHQQGKNHGIVRG